MRLADGTWQCALCGARMDVPDDGLPFVVFSTTGDHPQYRVVILRDEEIHRCAIRSEDANPSPIP